MDAFLFKHHGRWMSTRAPPGSAARGLYPVVSVVEKFPVLAPTCTGKQKVCFLDCPSRQMFAQRVGECSAKQLDCSECRSAGLQDLGFVQKCAGGNWQCCLWNTLQLLQVKGHLKMLSYWSSTFIQAFSLKVSNSIFMASFILRAGFDVPVPSCSSLPVFKRFNQNAADRMNSLGFFLEEMCAVEYWTVRPCFSYWLITAAIRLCAFWISPLAPV